MRIAFVNDTFLEGRGADTVIYELARKLGKKHEVFVITTKSNLPEENFDILRINARKLLSGNYLKDSLYPLNIRNFRKEVLKLHKKYNFDVFNVHHSSLNPAFKRIGIPVIVTWHGSPVSNNSIRIKFNKLVLKSLNKNKVSIAISEYIKSELAKKVSKNKIKRIYNGVSSEFKPLKKYSDKNYMLYVGRLEPHKSVHELIRLSKNLNFSLHIVGSGPIENKLKDYAKRISADKVIFLGRVPRKDLIKQYQECSFFISASKWEGFGLIFIEAAACAKPSVGYNNCSVPEVILNDKTGFIIKNYGELKQRAETLIRDKKLRKKMGKEALKFSKNFSWGKSTEEYLKIFELSK
jgi:glycosyltransferase involved in cell wall biosynthesis